LGPTSSGQMDNRTDGAKAVPALPLVVRTVQTRLAHVFAKLDVASRVRAARLLPAWGYVRSAIGRSRMRP